MQSDRSDEQENKTWVEASCSVEEVDSSTNAAETDSVVIEVVAAQEHEQHSQTPQSNRDKSGASTCSSTSTVDEDCLTVTEVTDLSTIDEITVEDDEFDEHSCRTTATMVSSNAGSPPSLLSEECTTRATRADRGPPKKPSVLADYLRIVSQHCQVKSFKSLTVRRAILYLSSHKPFGCTRSRILFTIDGMGGSHDYSLIRYSQPQFDRLQETFKFLLFHFPRVTLIFGCNL